MSVSVVLPTKDRLASLKAVLPSYFMQPEVDEVIVVIDGSSDGTREYLDGLRIEQSKLRVLDNERNRGIPYSKNRGIQSALSSNIFFGEDDVELTPNFFATLLAHKETLGVDIICGRNVWVHPDEDAQTALDRTAKLPGPYVNIETISIDTSLALAQDELQLMLANPMLGDASIFKSIRFDERYTVNFWREETDFQISAQEFGYKLGCCPHAICFNYQFEGDRGGAHAAAGLRRTKWVVINNWRFVNKHRVFLRQNFRIGNEYLYISKFAIRRLGSEVVLPFLIDTKRRLLDLRVGR